MAGTTRAAISEPITAPTAGTAMKMPYQDLETPSGPVARRTSRPAVAEENRLIEPEMNATRRSSRCSQK